MSGSVIQVSVPSTDLVQPSDLYPFIQDYSGSEDAFLTTLIESALNYVEDMSGFCLMPRDFIQYRDRFPIFPFAGAAFGPLFGVATPFFLNGPITGYPGGFEAIRNPFEIIIQRNPVQSVGNITYFDLTNTPQTLVAGTDFLVDLTGQLARITPPARGTWPLALQQPKAVAIPFVAGFFTTLNELTTESQPRVLGYPPILKTVVKQLAAHWYQNRDVSVVPCGIDDLIYKNRVVDYHPEF
jgi:hypothetical protein